MKKIVIVGGGLAGLEVAKELSAHESFEILLIDKNNYNFFPPLLYQVSTAFIEASNTSYPFRRLFQNRKNVDFFMGGFIRVIYCSDRFGRCVLRLPDPGDGHGNQLLRQQKHSPQCIADENDQ